MGHLGLTTTENHYSGERFARGTVGQAGVIADPFAAWIDDWRLAGDDLDALDLTATVADVGFDLSLRAEGPLVFHGENGFSIKSASGQASYYYSQPFYQVSGTLSLPSGEVGVTGQGWLDLEWSSQPLEDDQDGWDWFSLHFDGGARMMAFQLRGGAPFTYVSWIEPDGTLSPYYGSLDLEPLEFTEIEGRKVPTRWSLRFPERGVDLKIEAVNPKSWQNTLFPYWEGPVTAEGSHKAKGYLEMTGYE
jgi:predicted secreted hydrolase